MAAPYRLTESSRRGLAVLRRGSITLAGIEDLLARAPRVRDVTASMLAKWCDERRVDLPKRLHRGRQQLYRRYLRHCFENKALSADERADLAHLRTLLHLSAEDLAALHDDVAIEVYGEAVHEVLENFHLDDEEAEFLLGLRDILGLTEAKADPIYSDESSEARTRALCRAEASDLQFIEHHVAAGEFTGRSDQTLEDAVENALAKAVLAVPRLYWFEVSEIAGYVDAGKPKSWHVTLRAGIRKEDS